MKIFAKIMQATIMAFLIFFVLAGSSHAQTGIVRGQISNTRQQPVAGINVILLGTQSGGASDQNGRYQINDIPPGSYTLVASGVGYVAQKKAIQVKGGQTLTVNITLSVSDEEMPGIVIQGSPINPYAVAKSDYVAKMPLKRLENPQVYTTIPKTLLQQQIAVNYTDIFKNISGSEVPSVANNGRIDISSRGFKVRSQIVDGVSGYTMTNIDPANIEKVEVIKGPSATLFGSSLTSYGGLVNIVTKRPYDYQGANVSYTIGSFGLNRLTLDGNTPLDKRHSLLFRINGAGQSKKSYQDAGFAKSILVAPSVVWKINKRISLDVDAEYYDRKATSPFWFVPYKKSDVRDVRDLGMDFSRSFINNDVFYTAKQVNVRARLNTDLGSEWHGQTVFVRTANNMAGDMLALRGISNTTLMHSVEAGPQHFSTVEIQQNFRNDRTIGRIRNRLLMGLDFYHYDDNEATTTINSDTVNFIHPGAAYSSFNRGYIDRQLTAADYKKTSTNQNTFSVYASDVISLNKRWYAMLSLRLDHFENKGMRDPGSGEVTGRFGQTTLSPKLGLVYQPVRGEVSLFANYMNGFQNVNGTDYEGNSFKPQQANQLEGGVKLSLLQGRLAGTVSVYHILVDKILRDDPEHINYSVQDGTELSRGIELDAIANPLPHLNIVAGYAYNYCVYQKADDGLSGRRPDGAGPQHTANLWVSYEIENGWIRGFGIGAGGIYGSSLQTIKSFSGTFEVPGYTVLDATVFYKHQFYRIGLKLNNLNDEQYWDNRLKIQPPRSLVANLDLSF